jgi:hypothetical protein
MKPPKMPRKYRAKPQSLAHEFPYNPGASYPEKEGAPLNGDQPRLESASDYARAERRIRGSAEPLGDKLDEIQWRILTRIDTNMLDYCSDGQYLIVIRMFRGVASAAAAKTADSDRLVVTVEGPEVYLEHCCDFCARPAIGRLPPGHGVPSGIVCAQCSGAMPVEPL